MPYKDPEAKKAWRRRNSESINRYTEAWKAANPDRVAIHREKMKAKRREEARLRPKKPRSPMTDPGYQRRWRTAQRLHAIEIMGGCCERCGFSDPLALEFDHKDPLLRGSNGLRRGDNTHDLRRHIENGTLEEVFQLLCANCHRIKTREGGEFAMRGIGAQSTEPPATLPLFGAAGPWTH